jgi:glycosyltransferase involved in cell wall biosynthesis
MKCKICETESKHFESALVLNKYKVNYFQCVNCGFVQTEDPYWLQEAYTSAIAKSDYGILARNIVFARLTAKTIVHGFNVSGKFVDYGSGYGLLVRLMRDLGFNFYAYDKYCENIFAEGFDCLDAADNTYELVTAFEVLEHFVNPIQDIQNLLSLSKNILFSTELLPSNNPTPSQWHYYALTEGQHVSIYTKKSLEILSEKLGLHLVTNGYSVHLLSQNKLSDRFTHNVKLEEYHPLNIFPLLRSVIDGQTITKESPSIIQDTLAQNEYLEKSKSKGLLIVDGVFFQLYNTGIARVWKSLLAEWVKTGFANHVVVLDRNNTAPKIPGVWYRTIPAYSYDDTESDRQMLQQVCDKEGASLFISTYYTTPLTTPSVFMAYDMIPEVMKADLNHPMWREKHHAIQHASSYISISENTASDLAKFFPDIALESIAVAHCGVQTSFTPATDREVSNFKHKYGIRQPYFMLVGTSGYKNGELFLKAFAQLPTKNVFDIVLTGASSLTEEQRNYTAGSTVHILQLNDAELRLAYSGAVALVYPSKYEGFGLPVLEALACGCPVITCPKASIPEVAGDAALYVDEADIDAMANALCEVQKPTIRNSLIAAGLQQAKTFSWSKMADKVSSALIDATLSHLNLNQNNLVIFPDWSQPEEELGMELMQAIHYVASSSEKEQTTLLIDIINTSEEEANLMLSSVAMNLMMEAELDVSEGPEISLVSDLSSIQWEALLPKINGRIILENDNSEAIASAQALDLPTIRLTVE